MTKLRIAIVFICLLGIATFALGTVTVTKRLIGKEDINFGTGTFTVTTSTGGTQTMSKVNATFLTVIDTGAYYTGTTVESILAEHYIGKHKRLNGIYMASAYADIQAAIDEAEADGGGLVILPQGTVNISSIAPITIENDGITLMGQGRGAALSNTTAGVDAINIGTTTANITGVSLINFTVSGAGGSGDGVVIQNCTDCRLDQLKISGHGGDGVRITTTFATTGVSYNNSISNSYIISNTQDGLHITTGAANTHQLENYFSNTMLVTNGDGTSYYNLRIDGGTSGDTDSNFFSNVSFNGTGDVYLTTTDHNSFTNCNFTDVNLDTAATENSFLGCNISGNVEDLDGSVYDNNTFLNNSIGAGGEVPDNQIGSSENLHVMAVTTFRTTVGVNGLATFNAGILAQTAGTVDLDVPATSRTFTPDANDTYDFGDSTHYWDQAFFDIVDLKDHTTGTNTEGTFIYRSDIDEYQGVIGADAAANTVNFATWRDSTLSAAASTMGTFSLVDGTFSVETTAVATTSVIQLTRQGRAGTVLGCLGVEHITASNSFMVYANTCATPGTPADDDSVIFWWIVN